MSNVVGGLVQAAPGLLPASVSDGAAAPQPASASVAPMTTAPNTVEAEVSQEAEPTPRLSLDKESELFLFSQWYSDSVQNVKKEFSLTNDQSSLIVDLDRMVFASDLTLEQYLLALEDQFAALSETDRDRLYSKLLAERFVPFGERFSPTATDVARSEGLKLPTGSYYRIYTKPLSYSGAATEVAQTAGFSIMGGSMRERMRDLVMSKLKGVRADAQVREVLVRGQDMGGVGLDPAAADRAMAAMGDILSRATIMSEDEYANWLADQARPKAPTASTSTASIEDQQDPEIAAIQAKMASQPQAPASELEKAVTATVGRLNYTAPNEYLAKRLSNVISSRLRDVRSGLELKQLLMRDTKVGGLGLKADQADPLAAQIEEAYAEFHGVIAQEEKGKIEKQLEEQKRKVEERRKHEAEEHARWFEEKIRARKTGEAQKTQVLENMRRVMGGQTSPLQMPAHPIDAKEQRIETEKFGPLVPAATGVKQEASVKPQASTQVKTQASVARPAELKVSPATVKLAQANAMSRPSLDGMSYAGPQLVGLVGELKRLTVAEFRRLSKNPQDAAEKIKQKIETLSQESFDKRVEGIRAFQESPLQGAYMALVGESFKLMRPVVALADEKRKAGSDTLSSDEIAAIMTLNSGLHF